MERQRPILTIGHSKMSADDFVSLCRRYWVKEIIDIRSHPTSKWEWFRREQMEQWLPEFGIRYEWEPGLGGWDVRHASDPELSKAMAEVGVNLSAYGRGVFPKQRIGADRVNGGDGAAWTNQGLYDYAWFTRLDEFQQAAERLVERTRTRELGRPAIMCCEALWWKCHRSMVADYLTHVLEYNTFHMQPKLVAHSAVIGARIDRYPTAVRNSWTADVKENTK